MRLFIVKWNSEDEEESITVIVKAEKETKAHTLAVKQIQEEECNDGEDFDRFDKMTITDVTEKTGVIHTSYEFIP